MSKGFGVSKTFVQSAVYNAPKTSVVHIPVYTTFTFFYMLYFIFLNSGFKVPLTPKFFISRQKSPFCSDHIGEKIIVVRFFLDFL